MKKPKTKRQKRKKPPTYQEQMARLAKRPAKDKPPSSSDALSRRLPGSFEQGKRR